MAEVMDSRRYKEKLDKLQQLAATLAKVERMFAVTTEPLGWTR